MMRLALLTMALAVLAASGRGFAQQGSGKADPAITIEGLLKEMIDYGAAARWPQPAYVCLHSSSYDRRSKTPADPAGWFANTDNMDQPTDAWTPQAHGDRYEWPLLDVDGPGCVVRFWTGGADPKGTIRFYLDGADAPAIESNFGQLVYGESFAPNPLGIKNPRGAGNLYLPIPYARHCTITYHEPNQPSPKARPRGRWYNIEYRTWPKGTRVETFTMERLKLAGRVVDQAAKALSDPPTFTGGKAASIDAAIESGKSASADLPAGPAAVRVMQMQLAGVEGESLERALRSTVLRVSFDGQELIWCPAGDFFGSGLGLNELKNWYRTVAGDGTMTCRWVMPYRKSARVTVENFGREKVAVKLKALADDWQWDGRSMYFHANWRYQFPIATRPFSDWNYITVTGQGVYMGDTLDVFNPVAKWWGEGDEKIWVDGEAFPSHFGTGSEDYYGYAYGTPVVFQGPFCNQPRAGAHNLGHTTNTRTRILDAIPFATSLKVDMEIWHWAECNVGYGVAAYWYALEGAKCNIAPRGADVTADIPQAR